MQTTVSRIAPGPVFKLGFVLCTLLSLIGVLFSSLLFFSAAQIGAGLLGPEAERVLRAGGAAGALAVVFGGVFISLFSGLITAVILAIMAVVYNAMAAWIGGVVLTLDAHPRAVQLSSPAAEPPPAPGPRPAPEPEPRPAPAPPPPPDPYAPRDAGYLRALPTPPGTLAEPPPVEPGPRSSAGTDGSAGPTPPEEGPPSSSEGR
jgi:hypothetical protein